MYGIGVSAEMFYGKTLTSHVLFSISIEGYLGASLSCQFLYIPHAHRWKQLKDRVAELEGQVHYLREVSRAIFSFPLIHPLTLARPQSTFRLAAALFLLQSLFPPSSSVTLQYMHKWRAYRKRVLRERCA